MCWCTSHFEFGLQVKVMARIAFLQGERKGQENLKQDLVRRIKMLEFALKQERAKFHKLKYGTELNQAEVKVPVFDEEDKEKSFDAESLTNSTNSNASWKQGRQLLRQYLQEIGYTDTIIDVRSARVRQLLGLQNQTDDDNRPLVNGEQTGKRPSETQGRRTGNKKLTSVVQSALAESEESVMSTFDFLSGEQVVDEDEENLSDGENEENGTADDDDEDRLEKRRTKKILGNESMADQGIDEVLTADPETEEALAEFDFLVSESGEGAGEARSQGDGTDWEKKDLSPSEDWGVDQQLISRLTEQYRKERQKGKKAIQQRPKRSTLQDMLVNLGNQDDSSVQANSVSSPRAGNNMTSLDDSGEYDQEELGDYGRNRVLGVAGPEDDALEAALGLGELADLTVNNDVDPLNYDINSPKEAFRKTWTAKYTLRSHFDGVRALAFHPVEPVLLTASEDHTLKLWNLQKTVPAKKTSASVDVEPVYTFRAHRGPVLCLAMSPTGECCYSGGADATIRCWNIPNSNIDPYDSFDPSVLQDTLDAHTNAVWGLSIHSSRMQLLSCSADGTIRLWSPGTKSPLLNTFRVEEEEGLPTSVDFVRCEPNQLVVSYSSANTYIFDIETAKQIIMLESKQENEYFLSPLESGVAGQINRVISHPTLPITITAHEDRHIRFYDNNTGKVVHSMVAHLEAVTSLAVDPNGLYLLSGSHDCSIRLWNLDSKTCVQEITSHRKKFDESIHDVAFHPSKPYIASAGADALAKVFV
ncbi:hypothetical protein LSH36_697g00020 [Paralvinella palmiformis]|uniref:Striatin N-terminal domain-containing protein n=1 Tax=Paralvinella palmiformis TaxID=53620 RepID=A0AAD9J252_9ANNE|nr:hypothetical protein LSH36_697g00020 [Paralvinella palmiformis]